MRRSPFLHRSSIIRVVSRCTTTRALQTRFLSEVGICALQSLPVEGYYDYLSNKNIHVGVSGCYKDNLRKVIATFTSNYTLYAFYLRVRCIIIG